MHLGITDQVRRAAQKQNRLAALIGAVLGAFVPLATYTLAHAEVAFDTWIGRVALGLVLAGLAYSATTVYVWARIAFRALPKAIGFVVLLEGTMTLASSTWLSLSALVILVGINALATACNLAEDQKEHRKQERAKAKAPVRTEVTYKLADGPLAPGHYQAKTSSVKVATKPALKVVRKRPTAAKVARKPVRRAAR